MTEQRQSPVDKLAVGKIIGTFGVKGWVKVFSDTSPRENILDYSPWHIEKGNDRKTVKVVDGRRQGQTLVVQLKNIIDRNQAELLAGYTINIKRQQLPEPKPDEYYWSDLVGLKVVTVDDEDLGIVDYMLETGANDVLLVQGERERLIPFLQDQTVLKIDLQAGLIQVDWDPEF